MKRAIIKQLLLVPALLAVASCSGRVDLADLKMGGKLPLRISDRLEKDHDLNYGLDGYKTRDLTPFRLAKINLTSSELFTGERIATIPHRSELFVFSDNYTDNNFLGFYLTSINEQEQQEICAYLEEKYQKPDLYEELTQHVKNQPEKCVNAVWIDDANNQWILLRRFTLTDSCRMITLTFVRQGTRLKNSKDESVPTILEGFKRGKFGDKIPITII